MKIPFKWKARWFLRGMVSIFHPTPLKQAIKEAKLCADEMERRKP